MNIITKTELLDRTRAIKLADVRALLGEDYIKSYNKGYAGSQRGTAGERYQGDNVAYFGWEAYEVGTEKWNDDFTQDALLAELGKAEVAAELAAKQDDGPRYAYNKYGVTQFFANRAEQDDDNPRAAYRRHSPGAWSTYDIGGASLGPAATEDEARALCEAYALGTGPRSYTADTAYYTDPACTFARDPQHAGTDCPECHQDATRLTAAGVPAERLRISQRAALRAIQEDAKPIDHAVIVTTCDRCQERHDILSACVFPQA